MVGVRLIPGCMVGRNLAHNNQPVLKNDLKKHAQSYAQSFAQSSQNELNFCDYNVDLSTGYELGTTLHFDSLRLSPTC
jgi:hypothetical protein